MGTGRGSNYGDVGFNIAAEGGYIPEIAFGVGFVDRRSTVGNNLKTAMLFGVCPIRAKRGGVGAGKCVKNCDIWESHVSSIILLNRVNPAYFSLSAVRHECRTGRIRRIETCDRAG